MKNSTGRLGLGRCLVSALALQFLITGAALADEPWSERTRALGAIAEMPTGVLSRDKLETLTETGKALFEASFTTLDGVGRPGATQAIDPTRRKHPREQAFFRTAGPDAGSCAACHNQPVTGAPGILLPTCLRRKDLRAPTSIHWTRSFPVNGVQTTSSVRALSNYWPAR